MIERLRAAGKWLWDWITVLSGILVGVPAVLFEVLDMLGGTDLTPLLPSGQAAKIITFVAVAKAIYASTRAKA